MLACECQESGTLGPRDFLLSVCVDSCCNDSHGVPPPRLCHHPGPLHGPMCHLLSNILIFGMLLWTNFHQTINSMVSKCVGCVLLAFSGCHKLALGSLVPPRKWSQKADVAEQWAFIPPEKTAIVSMKHTQCTVKGCIEIRKLIHLAKNISLSSNKQHHYFTFFYSPTYQCNGLIWITDTASVCVCVC